MPRVFSSLDIRRGFRPMYTTAWLGSSLITGLGHFGVLRVDRRPYGQAGVGHIVVDAHGKVLLRHLPPTTEMWLGTPAVPTSMGWGFRVQLDQLVARSLGMSRSCQIWVKHGFFFSKKFTPPKNQHDTWKWDTPAKGDSCWKLQYHFEVPSWCVGVWMYTNKYISKGRIKQNDNLETVLWL